MVISGVKRLSVYTGLMGWLAAAAFATPASADLKGVCFIDGEMKMQDKHVANLGMHLLGGEGKFTFRSLLVNCLADRRKTGIPDLSALAIRATGWYDNTVCGTGKLFGTITETFGGPGGFGVMVGEEFAVQFAGGAGVFKWRDWDKPDAPFPKLEPESDDPRKTPYDGTPAGAVTLVPLTTTKLATPEQHLDNLQEGECAKAFRLTGLIEVHFAD